MSGEQWVAGAYALDIWEGVLMSRPEAAQTAVAAVGSVGVVCCGPLQASLIKCQPALPSEAPT